MEIVVSKNLAGIAPVFPEGTVHLWDYTDPPLSDAVLKRCKFYIPTYMSPSKAMAPTREMPNLEVVQLQSAGFEAYLPLLPPGMTMCNARGVHDDSTAELAVALLLASLRHIPEFVRNAAVGRWDSISTRSLADSTVMILGYGSIGGAIERRLSGFEVEIVKVARGGREGVHPIGELHALLPTVDAVIIILPLTDETSGLLGAEEFALLRDGATVVNVARGGVVDMEALTSEVCSGRLNAALDVTDPEPLPSDHPLWAAPNCLISPHVGGKTNAFEPRMERLAIENIHRFQRGDALMNVVHSEA